VSQPGASRLGWYARRIARMSPGEVAWRARDQAVQLAWARRQVRPGQQPPALPPGPRSFTSVLPPAARDAVPPAARDAVTAAADALMRGEWEVLGVSRTDLAEPDWFADPVTGRRSAPGRYCFRVNQRSEEQVGNIKQVWEIARLQHLTLLATAYWLTGDEAYADRVAAQLRSFWQENPFLSGVHWTSGIEIGIRLISFAWIRRLLDDWPGAGGLFEDSGLAVAQIRWHQRYLAGFRSRGSSANNHVIAEAAGQLAASCAFPWFPESPRWRRRAARLLADELARNTFPSGINRELASDYHGFVAELGLYAAVEAAAAGHPVGDAAWQRLAAMTDAAAALVDVRLRPPRQGDGDEGRALLLDAPAANRWPSLLALGAALFGPLDWWPPARPDASSVLIGALAGEPRPVAGRPARRPSRFADAGLTILRTPPGPGPEIWCRCDGGPHGFLSIAAHAHADALSVEVRHDGVDILADPGTYCYHGDPPWRAYFRSTIAHNTAELAGRSQSGDGGPFLWIQHAAGRETAATVAGDVLSWAGEHDGYAALDPPATHRRVVRLDTSARALEITDEIASAGHADGGGHAVRLALHLGPEVAAELAGGPAGGSVATLRWPGAQARLSLPAGLAWSLHRGETEPILGWYAEGLGRRCPSYTLLGLGSAGTRSAFVTRLEFHEPPSPPDSSVTWADVSLRTPGTQPGQTTGSRAEAG
jgi:Heparinase II/III-like protein/Heparinase II/III N-terminus